MKYWLIYYRSDANLILSCLFKVGSLIIWKRSTSLLAQLFYKENKSK